MSKCTLDCVILTLDVVESTGRELSSPVSAWSIWAESSKVLRTAVFTLGLALGALIESVALRTTVDANDIGSVAATAGASATTASTAIGIPAATTTIARRAR